MNGMVYLNENINGTICFICQQYDIQEVIEFSKIQYIKRGRADWIFPMKKGNTGDTCNEDNSL